VASDPRAEVSHYADEIRTLPAQPRAPLQCNSDPTDKRRVRPRWHLSIVVLAAALVFGCVVCASASTGSGPCSLFAAPDGSDAAAGTAAAPFRTAQRLADALRAGQTGCLANGTYTGYLRVTHGGRAGATLTIRSVPGSMATVRGRVWIRAGSDDVTLSGLRIVGAPTPASCATGQCSNIPTVAINGRAATLRGDRITNNHTSICVAVGSDQWGVARETRIVGDVIHDCGRLPATNLEHGIYVGDAVDTVIRSNYIYDNADRGIQLFPHARDTTVEGNVIEANGEGILIGGVGGDPTRDSVIEHNLITDSRRGGNVESYFPSRPPAALLNQVTDNCLSGGQVNASSGGVVGAGRGFSARDNVMTPVANLTRGRPVGVRARHRAETAIARSRCRAVFRIPPRD
jgi:parallel beta-helix repeat protein